MRSQHLRAGMIKRHQHTAIPSMYFPDRFLNEVDSECALALKRHRSERDDHLWINSSIVRFESRNSCRLLRGRFAVGARSRTRIAQGRTGNKNFSSLQVDGVEEPFEVSTRLIAGKGNTRAIRAFAAGSFADEHHRCAEWSIQMTKHRSAFTHCWAANAGGGFAHQLRELRFFI